MENISQHISYKEATKSNTALLLMINNDPDSAAINKMKIVAEKVFEPLRSWYGKPIPVSSFYRSQELNDKITNKENSVSQHIKGEAMDLDTGSIQENKKLFDYIRKNLIFDQLIWENGGEWIHVSYKSASNRMEVLELGKGKYTEPEGMTFEIFAKEYWYILLIGGILVTIIIWLLFKLYKK